MTEADTQARSVYIWVAEGTWRATVDAALDLAPAGSVFTLLHVTPDEVPDAARGAYAGLFGRAGRDPAVRLEQMAAASAGELLAAASRRAQQLAGQRREAVRAEFDAEIQREQAAGAAEIARITQAARNGHDLAVQLAVTFVLTGEASQCSSR